MISIIIPVYNHAKSLRRCLNSLAGQDFKDFEIIIVNDGSIDNTSEVAREFIECFKKDGIRYEIIEQGNKGAPNARNHGYRESKGDFILFCDADAILERNCLSEMIKALEGNLGVSYAYSAHYWGRKIFKLWPFDANKLRQMPYIHSVSLIRKKDFPITGWDENIKRLQDWDLWLTMLEENHQGVWIDKPLFKISTGGTMSSWLPSVAYKIFPFLPGVKKYKKALEIVKKKHNLL
jgi:glycosyltransferase involved in cell wall biosynthesis